MMTVDGPIHDNPGDIEESEFLPAPGITR